MQLPSKIDIAVIAPYPTKQRVKEGWMSRINAVDTILKGERRLYVNIAEHHLRGRDDQLTQVEDNGWEVCLSPLDMEHQQLIDDIINSSKLCYVHTIHLAEYIQPWLGTGKIVVDFHGIVPEEEAMLGRPELSPKYENIEKQVLRCARACVMVTRSMERHYREKYPDIAPNAIILPIVESLPVSIGHLEVEFRPELPVRVVYAGGLQVWQNVNGMIDLARCTENFSKFTFLSHEWESIEESARRRGAPMDMSFRFCEKSGLASEYRQHDFGLVLRDDSPVNRVACPTKLYEYMCNGLIPIVRTPELGDFMDFGYSYITENEFEDGFFPDLVSRRLMAKRNLDSIFSIKEVFVAGAECLNRMAK